MLDSIKKRLIRFKTDGNITADFVASRRRKAAAMRRLIHLCFYLQCIAAAACVVCGFMLDSTTVGILLAVAAVAVVLFAFITLGRFSFLNIVSCLLDAVYTAICFILGGRLFNMCGLIMLAATLLAFIGFITGYLRIYLLDYSPIMITSDDYILNPGAARPVKKSVLDDIHDVIYPFAKPVPPPPPKSELMLLAEEVTRLMKRPKPEKPAPEVAPDEKETPASQNTPTEAKKDGTAKEAQLPEKAAPAKQEAPADNKAPDNPPEKQDKPAENAAPAAGQQGAYQHDAEQQGNES